MEQISDFLQGPQLTAYGLSCLHKDLEEKKPCVLFWNNHWSTVIKFEEELYILASDSSFLSSESGAVWQKLKDVNGGGSFVDSSFTPIKYAGEGASFSVIRLVKFRVTKNLLIPNGGPRDLVERMNEIILEEMLLLERKIRSIQTFQFHVMRTCQLLKW